MAEITKDNQKEYEIFVTYKKEALDIVFSRYVEHDNYDYTKNVPTKSARKWLRKVINNINKLTYEEVFDDISIDD